NKVVATYKELQHHLEEGKLDWHHLGEELKDIAKPIRDLSHHDNMDLYKPLEDAVNRQDQAGLEKAFKNIFNHLVRENLHRTEDTAGDLEKNVKGFIENARMAYSPLAGEHDSADKQVEQIFKEMEATASEARALKTKLEAQKKELETLLGKAPGH
ncbi:MAG: hypothetical protein GTO54_01910, partial [Nitrososphaeria archaeon]|nr:hypothetical protein [Nitrososphaeria archaeon]